jgi:hypothetical protein
MLLIKSYARTGEPSILDVFRERQFKFTVHYLRMKKEEYTDTLLTAATKQGRHQSTLCKR